MKKKTFNTTRLTTFAPTIASLTGVSAPNDGEKETLPALEKACEEAFGKKMVDKILIYNPDAIGEEFFRRYEKTIFPPLVERAQYTQEFLTAFPPKTPVCFATMFTGADPSVHGINHYEKPVLKIDTLFDVWSREGKKVALISKGGQSIPKIFAERNIDYFITNGDRESVDKAIELLKSSDYDVIEVYNQEYDDKLHVTHPRSFACKRAARHYVASYVRLTDAVKTYWKDYASLITFSPDHGAHRIGKILLGTHGKDIPSDRNILHFFSFYGGKHE